MGIGGIPDGPGGRIVHVVLHAHPDMLDSLAGEHICGAGCRDRRGPDGDEFVVAVHQHFQTQLAVAHTCAGAGEGGHGSRGKRRGEDHLPGHQAVGVAVARGLDRDPLAGGRGPHAVHDAPWQTDETGQGITTVNWVEIPGDQCEGVQICGRRVVDLAEQQMPGVVPPEVWCGQGHRRLGLRLADEERVGARPAPVCGFGGQGEAAGSRVAGDDPCR